MINIGDLAVYRSGRKKDADKVVEVDSMTECRVRVVERVEGGGVPHVQRLAGEADQA